MKLSLFSVALLFSITSFAQKSADEKAIKSMCGCYEIKFNFAETFNYAKDASKYTPSKVKHETALEWVELIEENPNKLSLQHLLIVGENMVIKHWRQDWLFENTHFYDYNGFEDWKFITKSKNDVKGQWTQSVFEVDDKPRYTGSASWVHIDGRHFWNNTTNAPLPRREYTQRNDYNITRRTNLHEIVANGWIHNQDNDKIVRDSQGNDYLLAQEKGYNVYTKVDDAKCKAAQKWWKENQAFWQKVRQKWNEEFSKNRDLKLEKTIDGKPLYMHLNALPENTSQAEINKIIERFIISK